MKILHFSEIFFQFSTILGLKVENWWIKLEYPLNFHPKPLFPPDINLLHILSTYKKQVVFHRLWKVCKTIVTPLFIGLFSCLILWKRQLTTFHFSTFPHKRVFHWKFSIHFPRGKMWKVEKSLYSSEYMALIRWKTY